MDHWTKEETLLLISLYEKYPALYDKSYSFNYFEMEKMWQSIADEMKEFRQNTTTADVKKKITTLKNQLSREIYSKTHPYKRTLWCFDDLDFLIKFYQPKKKKSLNEENSMKVNNDEGNIITNQNKFPVAVERINETNLMLQYDISNNNSITEVKQNNTILLKETGKNDFLEETAMDIEKLQQNNCEKPFVEKSIPEEVPEITIVSVKDSQLWSKEQTLMLIHYYKQFPALYDTRIKEYYYPHKKREQWQELVQKMKTYKPNVNANDIKRKLTTLSNQWYRAKRDDEMAKAKLWCYDQLSDVMRFKMKKIPRKSISEILCSEESEENSLEVQEHSSEILHGNNLEIEENRSELQENILDMAKQNLKKKIPAKQKDILQILTEEIFSKSSEDEENHKNDKLEIKDLGRANTPLERGLKILAAAATPTTTEVTKNPTNFGKSHVPNISIKSSTGLVIKPAIQPRQTMIPTIPTNNPVTTARAVSSSVQPAVLSPVIPAGIKSSTGLVIKPAIQPRQTMILTIPTNNPVTTARAVSSSVQPAVLSPVIPNSTIVNNNQAFNGIQRINLSSIFPSSSTTVIQQPSVSNSSIQSRNLTPIISRVISAPSNAAPIIRPQTSQGIQNGLSNTSQIIITPVSKTFTPVQQNDNNLSFTISPSNVVYQLSSSSVASIPIRPPTPPMPKISAVHSQYAAETLVTSKACKIDFTHKDIEKNPKIYLGIEKKELGIIKVLANSCQLTQTQIFLILRKMRHHEPVEILADQFEMHPDEVVQTIIDYAPKMACMFRKCLKLASMKATPIDCALKRIQIAVHQPSYLTDQPEEICHYSKKVELRYLVSCTQTGFVNFVSKGLEMPTKQNNNISELFTFINNANPKSVYIVGKRFGKINESYLAHRNVKVKTSPTSISCKMHLIRVFNEIKQFKILANSEVPLRYEFVSIVDDFFVIACGLYNCKLM